VLNKKEDAPATLPEVALQKKGLQALLAYKPFEKIHIVNKKPNASPLH
jgi:hypothetical protein